MWNASRSDDVEPNVARTSRSALSAVTDPKLGSVVPLTSRRPTILPALNKTAALDTRERKHFLTHGLTYSSV